MDMHLETPVSPIARSFQGLHLMATSPPSYRLPIDTLSLLSHCLIT